jgi:LPS-assembly lipoprotein
MSWSDAGRLTLVMAMGLSLAGCFTPLYSESAHPGLVEDLRAIEVAPVNPPTGKVSGKSAATAVGLDPELDRADRLGHYLRNDLIFNLNGTGTTPAPKYKLTVTTKETTTTPTVQSQLGSADAATLTILAKYELTPYEGGKAIISSEAVSSAVYDLSLQRYANLRASRDAEIRLAKSLADEMELRIAAALAERQAH